MSDGDKDSLQRAAELLRRYASVIRDCHSSELERFDYIPEVEEAAENVERAAQRPSELTFNAFRRANAARCVKWHPAGIASWSPSDWLTAVTGELGELASLMKMRNRERDGLPGNKFSPSQKQIADELADVLTYLDLLAEVLGVDLGAAAVEKFNEVSKRVGFPDRIEPSCAVSPQVATPSNEPNQRQVLEGIHRAIAGVTKQYRSATEQACLDAAARALEQPSHIEPYRPANYPGDPTPPSHTVPTVSARGLWQKGITDAAAYLCGSTFMASDSAVVNACIALVETLKDNKYWGPPDTPPSAMATPADVLDAER